MTRTVQPVLALLLAVILLMAGSGPLGTVVSVRLGETDASTLVIGLVMAANFLGLTLGALFAFHIVTRVGHVRAFAAFAAIMAAATLAYPVVVDEPLWALYRITQGFCAAGLFVCIESWLNDSATPENRGTILAVYMTCLYFAQGGGQFVLTVPDESGYLIFSLIAMVIILAVVPVAMTPRAPPMIPNVSSLSFKRLWIASPLGIFGCISSGLVLGAIYSLAPVYASGFGLDLSDTATFMSAIIFGGVLLQWPLGRLSDRYDRRLVIVGTMVAGALVSFLMLPTPALGFWAMLVVGALYGGIGFAIYPLCVAHTNDHLEREERVGASGGLVLTYSVGATVGPPIAAAVMGEIGPSGLFVFSGVIGVVSIAFAIWRLRARPSVPADQQMRFQTLPRTTPVAAPLDPRAEEVVESVPTVSHAHAAETMEAIEAAAVQAEQAEFLELQGELDFGHPAAEPAPAETADADDRAHAPQSITGTER
ncbi:MFS transporter [Salinarimonas ramus]|uniref:MFS transporter n=1 Tax=Salinarimonas ramus TaxID=690164 RepID=A0A917V366_9HYPH|nr:MFS transporter [Salinarimonas ramus]GGK29626.1 MFS transporter [Salinarimonas ramus]